MLALAPQVLVLVLVLVPVPVPVPVLPALRMPTRPEPQLQPLPLPQRRPGSAAAAVSPSVACPGFRRSLRIALPRLVSSHPLRAGCYRSGGATLYSAAACTLSSAGQAGWLDWRNPPPAGATPISPGHGRGRCIRPPQSRQGDKTQEVAVDLSIG